MRGLHTRQRQYSIGDHSLIVSVLCGAVCSALCCGVVGAVICGVWCSVEWRVYVWCLVYSMVCVVCLCVDGGCVCLVGVVVFLATRSQQPNTRNKQETTGCFS